MTQALMRGAVVTAAGVALLVVPAAAGAMTTLTVYTQADSGKTVHLAAGTTFKVSLKTASDGGYFWTFRHRPDDAVVTLVSKHVRHPSGVVGGYSHTVYTFKSVGAGDTKEKLVEHRARSHKVIKRFALSQVVND